MAEIKPRLTPCPHCKKLIEYILSNQFRPFCSQRCQLIDLGDWANENYKIPDNSPPKPDDEFN